MANPRPTLRDLMARPGIVVAPGAADGLTAKLVQSIGFDAVHCTGGGISRSMGLADVGFMTLTDLVARVANIADVCDLPLIVDGDSGYGGALNLTRAVSLLEAAGASAIHIEDKEVPRRARDPLSNIVDAAEMVGRVKAALGARASPDFMIIARTEVFPVLGLDAAIERANRYADAGADLVYVEYLKTRADIEAVARRVSAPKVINRNKGEGESLAADVLAEMGYDILIVAADAQLAALFNMRAVLEHLKAHGSTETFRAIATFADRDEVIGLAAVRAIEDEYLP